MELINTVFSQLRADLNDKLNMAERQMVYLLKSQDSKDLIKNLEARIALLEARGAPTSVFETPAPQIRSGGLEGLLMKRENMPSPILGPTSANSVIVPTIQRQHTIVLEERPMTVFDSLNRARIIEEAEEEVDDEVAFGEVVAEQGGIDDEEEEEEEEEEVEEEVAEMDVEEEAEEALELEEFDWPPPPNPKSKKYFKDQYNKVYRSIDDAPEDEPFAEYDETNKKLVKIA